MQNANYVMCVLSCLSVWWFGGLMMCVYQETMYRDRVTQLRASPSSSNSALDSSLESDYQAVGPTSSASAFSAPEAYRGAVSYTDPAFPVNFKEIAMPHCNAEEFNVPITSIRHPFFLLRKIRQTLTTGAYLSPNFFVPPEAWDQPHLKFHMSTNKNQFCDGLCTLLVKFSAVDFGDTSSWARAADDFVRSAEILAAQQLSKVIPHINHWEESSGPSQKKESKFSEKLWKVGHAISKFTNSKKQSADNVPYTLWLTKLLERSDFIDGWIAKAEQSKFSHGTMERLHRISNFYRIVVCYFAIKDTCEVAERYIKKSRESYSRLFPKDYKTPQLPRASNL
eukprot:ANDGO_08582.mRNA.2 hypothetical protein CAOG_07244